MGYNLINLRPSKSHKVEAGDVIGWSTNSSAGDLAFENSADPEYFYPSSSFNIQPGLTLQKISPATRFDISHVIKAHLSQVSCASKDFVFDKGGVYGVTALVKNILPNENSMHQECQMYIQVGLSTYIYLLILTLPCPSL